MINFLWMLYIAVMLFATVLSIMDIIDSKSPSFKDTFSSVLITIIITCLIWAVFIVYYLN